MPRFQDNATEELFTIASGDVTDFIYVRPSVLEGGVIDANWTCSTHVIDDRDNIVVASTAITEKSGDNTEFKVYLTGAQTAALGNNGPRVTEYTWIITMENTVLSPQQHRTLRLRLGVI